MKKFITFVILLLFLGGGALGAAFYMKVGPFTEQPKKETPLVELGTTPVFLDMPALAVPVIDGNKVRRQVFVQVQLEVLPENEAQVTGVIPRLQSAFLIDLNQFFPVHMRDRATPNLAATKSRLLKVAEKVAGEGKVKDVLIKSSYER